MSGPLLGRYQLGEPIGAGPCGEVFRARAVGVTGFDRVFAVKRFHPVLAGHPAASELLAAAARAYGGIEHPRVARLHEYGADDHDTFVAVELVDGASFDRLLASTAAAGSLLPPGAGLGIVSRVARAVAYAHGKGVVHLGLCPQNVIATDDGEVKVCDFGFLRARLALGVSTDPAVVGRLPYLSPEQLEGGAGTAASDIFVLGSLAVEACTGAPAFGGKSATETAERLRNARLEIEAGAVPAALLEVIRRALAVDPGERWPSAEELAEALDGALRIAKPVGGRSDVAIAVRRVRRQRLGAARTTGPFPLPAPRSPSIAGLPPLGEPAEGTPPPKAPPAAEPAEAIASHQARARRNTDLGVAPPKLPAPAPAASPPRAKAAPLEPLKVEPAELPVASGRARRRIWLLLAAAAALLALYFVWDRSREVAREAAREAAPAAPGLANLPDGAPTVVAPAPAIDAGRAPPDAALLPDAAPPPAPAGQLLLASDPAGAMVYLDGAAKGNTPLELPATGDRHRLVVVHPGYRLYKSDIDGSGRVAVTLDRAPPFKGPAGIKVSCGSRGRLYVIVDGKDSGRLCPTEERIPVEVGRHTIELYDPVTDSTSTHPLEVKGTHFSTRLVVKD